MKIQKAEVCAHCEEKLVQKPGITASECPNPLCLGSMVEASGDILDNRRCPDCGSRSFKKVQPQKASQVSIVCECGLEFNAKAVTPALAPPPGYSSVVARVV